MQLLLVEDDAHLAHALADALKQQYVVTSVGTIREARKCIASRQAGMYIIDIGLPDGSGVDLIRDIRTHSPVAPILMLTASRGTSEKVRALDKGADDYLTKPFSVRELLARLRALLRRSNGSNLLQCGPLTVDRASRAFLVNGKIVSLSKRTFLLLESLMQHAGVVRTYDELTSLIWSEHEVPASNALAVYIQRLRRTLEREAGSHFIHTVPGIGYVLDPGRKGVYGGADEGSSYRS